MILRLSRRRAFDDEQREGVWQDRPASAAGGRRRAELRRDEEHAMTRRIEAHVASERCRLNVFDDVISIWRVLVDDGQGAVGVRGKHIPGCRIESTSVDT